jgi:hypothetical protein
LALVIAASDAMAGAAPTDPTVGAPAADAVAGDRAAGTAMLRRQGDIWAIRYDRDAFSMRDARGLHHLARLLAAPGREIHAVDLAQGGEGSSPGRGARGDGLASDPMSGHGPILDSTARTAYRDRIHELQAEIAEAEAWNDPERAAKAEAELDALTEQLASAVGLGGRDRVAGSAAERARISVTRAIRTVLARIAEQSPSLGAHLEATIRTGTYCSYTPDPRAPIRWDVG